MGRRRPGSFNATMVTHASPTLDWSTSYQAGSSRLVSPPRVSAPFVTLPRVLTVVRPHAAQGSRGKKSAGEAPFADACFDLVLRLV